MGVAEGADAVSLLPHRAWQPLSIWDAGISRRGLNNAHPVAKLDRTISDQLAQIGVKPEQIEFLGISHYHGDHTGQATQFPKAKLLIGAGDLAGLKSVPPPRGAVPPHIQLGSMERLRSRRSWKIKTYLATVG